MHAGCSQYPDVQQVLIDSTLARAHACAAGAAGSSPEAEALGRSKGGFSTLKFMRSPMRWGIRWTSF
ncbi:hypothetical protein [Methylobacter sp.]|uniref:hypothetical protein n=1 Tax=Methylobacter sp. TaxID=2051955 RepID=UPI003DA39A08